MIIAKHDQAHTNLSAQFKRHSISRVYEALILNVPKRHEGTIELAIGRDTVERKKFSARTSTTQSFSYGLSSDRTFW